MRRIARNSGLTVLLLILLCQTAPAEGIHGTVKLGAIVKDEDSGDLSAIQETANIYDGFSLSRIDLRGDLGEGNAFRLDVEEANLDSRRGFFSYRSADLFDLSARYNRHRRIFDADGTVESQRENWVFGGSLTPAAWLRINGDFNRQTREGGRWGYPAGVESSLGGRYDYTLGTGRVEAEARSGTSALAVGFEASRFEDGNLAEAERRGRVLFARANLPCRLFPGKVSHFLRGSLGKQELDQSGLDYQMSTFQYVGVARPSRPFQADYRLFLSRIENEGTGLKTDEVSNDFDLTWRHKHGKVFGGYGYVTHDSDKSLTGTNVWRIGAVIADKKFFKAKVGYASSEKTDTEHLTLLKDIETSRLRISLDTNPSDRVAFGVSFVDHDRKFPIIGVESTGQRLATHGRYTVPELGSLHVDYSYFDDQYIDQGSSFAADNHAVTCRVEVEKFRDLKLSAGVTYLDIGKDLDIEKSILMFAGEYTLQDDYFVEVKYNVYNYDDYILLDRFYTANVVWMNVGYKFSVD